MSKVENSRKFYHSDKGKVYTQKKNVQPKYRFLRGRTSALRRKKDFTLTEEQYVQIIDAPCYYCNESIANETGLGLDRKDNDRGYHLDNVLPCCVRCNRIRHKTMDPEEFKRQTILNGRRKDG
jgi:hypothetical protein